MMGLLGQSVLVSCIPECHSMPRFVIQRQSYGLGFGAFADAGKLDTLGGASSVSCRLLSLGIAAVIEFCLAACD